ncbi:hypothetical protein BOTBODRAFT_67841 [Botryobasidium botryosum FD-172 SS1]|uniref:DUF6593 domain-containing protein n=1 Tax=Botryobasidium botryosum (strain FD-172 SS1) TaxID=930990 RepID=A0A067MJA5_BOTB1|nr:hypothetical protein BOTBODRAFT_67841 [Botryobasidium botryosum FD-172 SS1]
MSPPLVANSLAFYFSANSMRNAVVTGSDVSYEITTPREIYHSGDRVTTITRVNRDGKKVIAGEYVWPPFKEARARMLSADRSTLGDWVPMSDFVRKTLGDMIRTSRTFSGTNGVQYKWSTKGVFGQHMTLTLDSDASARDSYALAVFHHPRHNIGLREVRKAYLEVSPNVQDDLDIILVTFLMVERKRRDREKRRQAG